MPDLEKSDAEKIMWEGLPSESRGTATDAEINLKYTKTDHRIVTEVNREQLPNFVEALKRPGWMDVRPFYQRRLRWDVLRQSRLIESFIMNIPIPPLFVYESEFAKYEVMDGQQRISTIRDFYANKLKLQGLEQWPELNGRIYDKLPGEIRKGIDRRSISYYVLLKESAVSSEGETLLRQQVFERLNTGGVKLSNQEIRNSVYHGRLNTLLMELVRNDTFRNAWRIPLYSPEEETNPSEKLLKMSMYSQMRDAEIILRFFALRHVEQYRNGMAGFLDLYCVRSRGFGDADVTFLRSLFQKTIVLGHQLFGASLFCPWDSQKHEWTSKPQVAFADAVMVGLSRHLDQGALLVDRRELVVDATVSLFENNEPNTFTGQQNTKRDVEARINLFDKMLSDLLRG